MGMTQKLAAPPGKCNLCISLHSELCLPSLQFKQGEKKKKGLSQLRQHMGIMASNQKLLQVVDRAVLK